MGIRLIRSGILLILVGCLHSLSAQNTIQLGDVVGSSSVQTRKVQVTGSPATVVSQAARLFDMHGGYERTSSRPEFTFRFSASGPVSINLEILSGGKSLWQSTFQGKTQLEALYAAGDAAVQRTLGIPGFFQSRVAFISNRTGHSEVYQSDVLFQSIRQLTRDRSHCLSPSISPDGRSLLYTSYYATGFPDIYRIDLVTGQRKVFAGFKGTNTGADYSPDGRSVAMILSGSGNSEVYLSNAEGHQLRRLTRTSSLEADPSWSPDGRQLVYTSDQMGGPQIFTMDVQGRSARRVRTDISRNCSEPVWNPKDPQQIAFTAAQAGEFEVAVFSFKDRRSRVVSKGSGDAVHPHWLNDGRHLIYTERTPRYSRLMILDTLTGKRFRLSPSELNSAQQADTFYYGR